MNKKYALTSLLVAELFFSLRNGYVGLATNVEQLTFYYLALPSENIRIDGRLSFNQKKMRLVNNIDKKFEHFNIGIEGIIQKEIRPNKENIQIKTYIHYKF